MVVVAADVGVRCLVHPFDELGQLGIGDLVFLRRTGHAVLPGACGWDGAKPLWGHCVDSFVRAPTTKHPAADAERARAPPAGTFPVPLSGGVSGGPHGNAD